MHRRSRHSAVGRLPEIDQDHDPVRRLRRQGRLNHAAASPRARLDGKARFRLAGARQVWCPAPRRELEKLRLHQQPHVLEVVGVQIPGVTLDAGLIALARSPLPPTRKMAWKRSGWSGDTLKKRIDEASEYVPLEQLALSPQCGFGAMRDAAPEEDVQWRKFEVIVETARSVWG